MTLLILLIITLAYFIRKHKNATHYTEEREVSIALSIIGIFFVSILMIAGQAETITFPEQRQALQESFDNARQTTTIERLGITSDVAQFNRELAEVKYWNRTFLFDSFISDNVETVDPIE